MHNGTQYEPAPPYTQHKNGVSERMLETLNTKARALMIDANLPSNFWAEAINAAVYLHQRTPTKALNGMTPYEKLLSKKPELEHLRRMGCVAYKQIASEQRKDGKFGARSKKCMMLGYVHDTGKIWKLWDFEQNRAIQCADVIFIEENNAFTKNSGSNESYFNIEESTSECEGPAACSSHPMNKCTSECGGGLAVSRHHINEGTSECGGPAVSRHHIIEESGRSEDACSAEPSEGPCKVKKTEKNRALLERVYESIKQDRSNAVTPPVQISALKSRRIYCCWTDRRRPRWGNSSLSHTSLVI
jgi:hypothetical protein